MPIILFVLDTDTFLVLYYFSAVQVLPEPDINSNGAFYIGTPFYECVASRIGL